MSINDEITFQAPPVFEVALSVQFDAIQLTAAHFGLFWTRVRERYPNAVEQPPIESVREEFQRVRLDRGPQLRVLEKPDTPRVWFLSADGTELVQVQKDRFVRNWRHHVPGLAYPRYPALRDRFASDFGIFVDFLEQEGLGDVRPTQVEVTYINHIAAKEGESHSRPDRHFTLGAIPDVLSGDDFEDVRVIAKWIMKEDGQPIGRLHLDLRPAYKTDSSEAVWNLNLVARGAPLPLPGMDGILGFMDRGRSRIVRAFDVLTTEAMHSLWQKRS